MTVQLYTPHSGQIDLHDCDARFRVMACGRRFGKTLAATNEIAKKALTKPSSLNWWIAPTYRQTEIAFNLLSDALAPVLSSKPNRSKLRLDLINNAVIECRSAERYENMRGDGPSFVVFDEASKCPKAAWTEVVRPALADTQGGAIFISTPWGHDWFYELFQRGQDTSEVDYWSKSFPTSANPFIPKAEIEEAKRTLPEMVFAQEFLAIFLDDAATVFRRVDKAAVGTFADPEQGHSYIIGWDLAKYTDFSVFTVLDTVTQSVVAWERFNGVDYDKQIDEHLLPLARRYNDAHVVMDSTGVGDPVLTEVRKRDISVEGYALSNNIAKNKLIDGAVVAVEKQYIIFPPIQTLIDELKSYGYEYTASRNIVYSAPDGKHDDCVISLALAIYGAKLSGPIPMVITSSAGPSPLEVIRNPKEEEWIYTRRMQAARSLRFVEDGIRQRSVKISGGSEWGIA